MEDAADDGVTNEEKPVWIVKNQRFTEDDIILLCNATSLFTKFKPGIFLKVVIYHMLNFHLGFLCIPIIWVADGFKLNNCYNMAFLGMSKDPTFKVQMIISLTLMAWIVITVIAFFDFNVK